MALANPPIDIRRFQDIVDEAKKKIPAYFDGWTDHNVSDPGVTFIELFAWMTEMILYQTNQMPDRHYLNIMKLLGIPLKGPETSHAPITFWLSEPQPDRVIIPKATEVATTQTESVASIIFNTNEDLVIEPPQWAAAFVLQGEHGEEGVLSRGKVIESNKFVGESELLEIFPLLPPNGQSGLYVGFKNDLSHHLLEFHVECDQPEGEAGYRAFMWETAVSHNKWQPCELDEDKTADFNHSGRMTIHIPEMSRQRFNGQDAYWVRVRPRQQSELEPGAKQFQNSPKLLSFTVDSRGGTVPASHGEYRLEELLGQSDGTPGQTFYLQAPPVLMPLLGNEQVAVVTKQNERTLWEYVSDFSKSQLQDRHFTLDSQTGELRFGPAIVRHQAEKQDPAISGQREVQTVMRYYGAVPPREAMIYFTGYRTGGGHKGNVKKGALNTLKTSIPFVNKVSNRERAINGKDHESLDESKIHAPRLLQARGRAVTATDFEYFALQAPQSNVARVHCFQPTPKDMGTSHVRPGEVHLLVVPKVNATPGDRLTLEQLQVTSEQKEVVLQHLEPYRMLTMRVDVSEPDYVWVAVDVALIDNPIYKRSAAHRRVLERLNSFLNPVFGGHEGKGWPFGQDLYEADIYMVLRELPEVLAVRNVALRRAQPTTGQPFDEAVKRLEVYDNNMIASGIHTITFGEGS
ncbi:MAG: putative baseplate assembly protein [Anaerolineales bacterium]|nr:putative baseplate assembly protein [Anaerolineales bacterium]